MPFSETKYFPHLDKPEISCDAAYVTSIQANTLAIIFLRYSGEVGAVCVKRNASVAMKQPYIPLVVVILRWHFISVPVGALPLSSAPSGQSCTQLKTCNSVSGI